MLRRYVPGPWVDETVVWYEGTGTTDRRWLHADERGSVIAISDGSGAMLNINRYDEFGIPQGTNAGRFQYTGQAWLPELGMQYSKARIYSPTLGRFMQTDPIGYGDGLNWYDYVGGDPVNFVDPMGLGANDFKDAVGNYWHFRCTGAGGGPLSCSWVSSGNDGSWRDISTSGPGPNPRPGRGGDGDGSQTKEDSRECYIIYGEEYCGATAVCVVAVAKEVNQNNGGAAILGAVAGGIHAAAQGDGWERPMKLDKRIVTPQRFRIFMGSLRGSIYAYGYTNIYSTFKALASKECLGGK